MNQSSAITNIKLYCDSPSGEHYYRTTHLLLLKGFDSMYFKTLYIRMYTQEPIMMLTTLSGQRHYGLFIYKNDYWLKCSVNKMKIINWCQYDIISFSQWNCTNIIRNLSMKISAEKSWFVILIFQMSTSQIINICISFYKFDMLWAYNFLIR